MTTHRFAAEGPAGAWRGSACARVAGPASGFAALLSARGLMRDDECLVGIELGGSSSPDEGGWLAHGLLVLRDGHRPGTGGDPLPVRKVSVRLTPAEWAEAFASLSATLSADGLLEGRLYDFLD